MAFLPLSDQAAMTLARLAVWVGLAFLFGALPLSAWLGRVALRTDITRYGDGNPGAANVWRAGGSRWGALAVVLDFLKGALPVSLAQFMVGLTGPGLAAAALAPVIGHAFSPFLRFRGGKALAVTFGVWAGLTLWQVPLVLGLSFGLWLALLRVEGWAVLAGMATLAVYLLIAGASPVWWWVWGGNTLILAWKHRADFIN